MKTISATDFHQNPGHVLEQAAGETVEIDEGGTPVGVLMSKTAYDDLYEIARVRDIERLERLRYDNAVAAVRKALQEARDACADEDDIYDDDGQNAALSIDMRQVGDHDFAADVEFGLNANMLVVTKPEDVKALYRGFDGAAEWLLQVFVENGWNEIRDFTPIETTVSEPDIDPRAGVNNKKPEIWLDAGVAVIRTFDRPDDVVTRGLSEDQIARLKALNEARWNGHYQPVGDAQFALALLQVVRPDHEGAEDDMSAAS